MVPKNDQEMKWSIINEQFIFDISSLSENSTEMSILSFLTDNDLGWITEEKCVIPAGAIYELTEGQRRLLSLPAEYPHFLLLKSSGLINQADFKYIPTFSVSKEYGAYALVDSKLPVVSLKSPNGVINEFILPETHYKTLKEVQIYKDADNNSDNAGYRSLSRIKPIAQSDSTIILNDYLRGYNVIEAQCIALSLDFSDGILEIKPDLSEDVVTDLGIEKNAFTNRFDRRNRVLPVYTIEGEGNTEHKVLIPSESSEKLSELKSSFRHISDS